MRMDVSIRISTVESMNVPAMSRKSDDDEHRDPGHARDAHHERGHLLGQVVPDDAVAERGRQGDQQHHHADVDDRVLERLDELLPRELAVGEHARR